MMRVFGKKLISLLPVLLLVSLATFFMIELVPGDTAQIVAGEDATIEQVEQIRRDLGLDRSLVVRYADWLVSTIQGDLGRSIAPPVQDVSSMIAQRFPVTLQIAIMAMVLAFLIAIPASLISASSPNSRLDRGLTAGAFASISVPNFLAALLIIFVFVFNQHLIKGAIVIAGLVVAGHIVSRSVSGLIAARETGDGLSELVRGLAFAGGVLIITIVLALRLPDFPRQGFSRLTGEEGLWANARTAFLPALTLASSEAAVFTRLLRSDLLTTLQEDYILAARAKGMPRWRILVRDALRPSSFSLLTVAGLSLGRLLGGTVIVEAIFNLPGMGSMLINAISSKDYAVVQAVVLVIAIFYVVINALVDLSYAALDPRIRRAR